MLLPNFRNPHQRIYLNSHRSPNLIRAQEIQTLLNQGYTQAEIGDYLGMKRTNVTHYIKRYGLKKE